MGTFHEWRRLQEGALPIKHLTSEEPETLDDLWDAVSTLAKAQSANDPVDTDHDVTFEALPVGLGFLADWHIGSRWVDYDHLKRFANDLAEFRRRDPQALFLSFLGDGTDGYLPNMGAVSGGLAEEVETNVDRQDRLFVHIIQKLGGLDLITTGCHWDWFKVHAGHDPLRWISEQTGARHCGQGFFLTARVGRQVYTVIGRHRFYGLSRLNVTNSHRRMFDEYEMPNGRRANIVAQAHLHVNRLHEEQRAGINTIWLSPGGAKGADEYARKIGVKHCLGPGEFGFPIVVLYPDTHRMVPFWGENYQEALRFLATERARYLSVVK